MQFALPIIRGAEISGASQLRVIAVGGLLRFEFCCRSPGHRIRYSHVGIEFLTPTILGAKVERRRVMHYVFWLHLKLTGAASLPIVMMPFRSIV